jgi:Ca-activated chloride channel family protein
VRRVLSLLLAAGAALGTSAGRLRAQNPQTPPGQPFTLEVEVYAVSVTAVVFDKGGRFIRDLGPKDVQLLEDGVPQELTYFREAAGGEEKIPLSIVLVLDASGSMAPNMHFLQEAAVNFVGKLEDIDQALVVSFNNSIKGSAEFTGDTTRLEEFVDSLQAWGGTSLYDAIHYSLGRVKDQPGRKALIVFSDGDDTTSQLKEQDVVDYARAVEATVYCVGIRGGAGGGGSPKGFLKKIAEDTGGQAFFPDRVGDLIKVFAGISEELHNHYALAYSPKRAPDGGYRAIALKVVTRPDAQVRVRKGYFSVKRKRPPVPPKPSSPP